MTPSEELRAIFEADRADRLGEVFPPGLADRDRARRRRVDELLGAGAANADDLYQAAMVFQHGGKVDDWRRTHELALRSAELGHSAARWLAAAAHARCLMGDHIGRSPRWRARRPPASAAPAHPATQSSCRWNQATLGCDRTSATRAAAADWGQLAE